jgi:hypothetical protein
MDVVEPFISDNFSKKEKPSKPIISIHTREPRDSAKIIKTFYLKYPQYRWITFRDMRGIKQEDFANFLKESYVSVWVDSESGFGTYPLESMISGTPVIGKVPNLKPEWMNEENGVWTYQFNEIVDIIANYTQNWLEDNISEELHAKMQETGLKYASKEKFDVSVILPINSSMNKNFDELFDRAIKSLEIQNLGINELVIVHSGEDNLKSFLNKYEFSGLTVNLIQNDGDFDFCTQVNLGVKNAKSKWVSILEFDDEYSSIWFKNVRRFAEAYPEVDTFLPLVVDTDEKGMFVGFTNEATFAASLNTEIGYLNNDVLLSYQNFQTSGMVIKKSTFESIGGFKPSMKLTFVYELLLRLTYNSTKIMTIPRIGYKHMNLREGSIFWNYKNGEEKISDNEVQFWIESAKKEHFFTNDRNIKYVSEEV